MRKNRSPLRAFPLASKLVLCFALLCSILAAIGGVFFFGLRSIKKLNSAERSSALGEIAVLDRVGKNAGLRQVEVFRHVAATNPEERQRHEQVIARLVEANTKNLTEYEKTADTEAEKRLYAAVLQARKLDSDRTEQLLALSRAQRNTEATAFVLTTQVPTYDRYQSSLDALLRLEEAEGRGIAASTTGRIEQTQVAGDILIGFAIVIALGTGAAVLRMVRTLRQDKKGLQTEVAEHEKAQQSLRESEARYRLLVDHSPNAIFVVCDEKIVFVNPATLKLLGADQPEQLIGRSLSKVVHPDEYAAVTRRSIEIAAGRQPPPAERRLLRLDGSAVDVESTVISFLYEGKPALQVIARNNAERKAAAEKLMAQARQYRILFEDNPSPMWVFDVQSLKILAVNQAAISSYGYSREEFLSRTLRDIRPAEDVARLVESISDASAPAGYGGEWRHLKKDGSIITAAVYSSPTIFDGKEARMALAVDRTEQAEAERKVRESEVNLALAQQVAGVGSWEYLFTADGQVDEGNLHWSQEAYRIFGLSPDESKISNEAFFATVHPDDRAFISDRFDVFKKGKEPFDSDYRIIRPDGTERIIHAVAEKIYDQQTSKPLKVVGTVLDITERRGVEQRLLEAHEKYRAIFDNALEGIFQSTPDGVFISVNPAFARMLGFASPEELIHERKDIKRQSYAEPAKRQEFKRLLEENGVVNDFEFEVKRKDGSTIWVSEDVRIVRDAAGIGLYYEGSAQDITERKRAELVLRESEEYLRLVIAASNDGIWEYDFLTDALTWSDRVYDMFGLDRRSFVPTLDSFTALLHPDDRAAFQKAVPEQMANGVRYEAHARILRGDGSYGHFLRRGRAVLDAAGKPTRMVGSFADLTSLFQAELKLVEQANLLNLAQDAIIVRDMNDRIEFWNHGAEVLYGWTAQEVRGRPSGDFLHYEEPVKILAERALIETGAWSGECRHLTKNGDTVVVHSRWTLVRDEKGQPKSKLVITTDITEQKKIEEQFLRAQRLESLGTLASGVAHDLNNILLPIMMAAPVLRGEIEPAERDKFLDIVESSAKRGADIIKQVLTFARGADGDRVLLQPIYVLEEVFNIARQTFPKSITVRTSYDENIRPLEADPTQLHQVLLNLCINARDALPNGGQLCLGAENFDVDDHYASMTPGATAGPHVMLEVTDTGDGIPSDVIEKIFDPFFTTKEVGDGTGLGLSTVAGIVKSHGGFIRVDSKPGHTSFKIFLPARAALETAGALQPEPIVPAGHGETILVVDDEPSIREVAGLILESNGYKVLLAEDGPTALAVFAQARQIAAVVTDLAMPFMGGVALVRALRRIDPELKIIVSTGRADDSQTAEIALLNVEACLSKPFTTRSLLIKLDQVLHHSLQDAA